MRTLGVVFTAPGRVEVAEVEVPASEPGDVQVRTLFSGISSGTEMLAFRGEIDGSVALDESIGSLEGAFHYPFRYGYSCVGVVEESRADIPEGKLVFAFHPHQARFATRSADVVPLERADPRHATLFPHVETALQVSLDAGAVAHELVAVLGMGAIGTLIAALLTRAGADVVCVEPKPWRRRAAEAFGLVCIEPDDAGEKVREMSRGRGASLVVEASGNPDILAGALELLAHEGTALVVSWYGNKPVSLPLGGPFHRRRLALKSTQVSTIPAALSGRWSVARRRAVAARLLEDLPLEALATHVFPLDEAPAAFAAVDRGEEGLIHAALSYPGR